MRIHTAKRTSTPLLISLALLLSVVFLVSSGPGGSTASAASGAGALAPTRVSCVDQWIARGTPGGGGGTCGGSPDYKLSTCGEINRDCYPALCAADRRLGIAAYAFSSASIPRLSVPLSFSPAAIATGVLQGIQEKDLWLQRLVDIYRAYGRNVGRTCGLNSSKKFQEAEWRVNAKNYRIRVSVSISLLPKGLQNAATIADALSYVSAFALMPQAWANRRTSTAPTRAKVGTKIRRKIAAGISVTDTSLNIRIF